MKNCPHCNASLQGEEIPENKRHLYGGATHFGSDIGIYSLEYDRTVAYRCPDCNGEWDRDYSEEERN